jgi:hypothetical protein
MDTSTRVSPQRGRGQYFSGQSSGAGRSPTAPPYLIVNATLLEVSLGVLVPPP